MVILLAAGFTGGMAGAALAWSHGVPAAMLCAPIGASLSTTVAAFVNAYVPASRSRRHPIAPDGGSASYEISGPN